MGATQRSTAESAYSDSRPIALLLVAWIILGAGTAHSNGHYDHASLLAVALAFGLTVGAVATLAGKPAGTGDGSDRFPIALGLAAGGALVAAIAYPAGIYGSGSGLVAARGLVVLAALGAALSVAIGGTVGRRMGAASIVAALSASFAMTLASPRPAIDVWYLLTQGAQRTLAGLNAYSECWTGSTDRLTDCVYPYLPGQLLVDAPFVLVGDVRFASVAALGLAAGFVWRIAAGPVAAILGALVVLQPKQLFLVEQSWTEPILIAAVCAMVWGVVTRRHVAAIAGFAVALACKQHVLLLVPLAAWWPEFGVRRTAVAVGAATLVTLPWFLSAPADFVADAIRFNLDLAPRADSLSLYARALELGTEPHFAVVVVGTLVAMAASMAELPRDGRGFTVGAAFVVLTFTLLNKQSFFNHYSLVVGLLVLAVAVLSRDPRHTAAAPSGPATSPRASPAGAG